MNQDNPYSPPNAAVYDMPDAEVASRIESLEVSDKWKERFRAIALAGGPSMPNLKALPKEQRRKAFSFNILAFLFGPFYYIFKGMWKRGIALFVVVFAVLLIAVLVLEYFDLGKIANALGYGVAAVFAVRANIDYYKKMVLKDDGWF